MSALVEPSEIDLGVIQSGLLTTLSPFANTTNATCPETSSDIPQAWGFISAGIAILFFGTNFAPVKKFDTGDGECTKYIMYEYPLIQD